MKKKKDSLSIKLLASICIAGFIAFSLSGVAILAILIKLLFKI